MNLRENGLVRFALPFLIQSGPAQSLRRNLRTFRLDAWSARRSIVDSRAGSDAFF